MDKAWLPKTFLIIAGTFGVALALLTPPFQVSDEFNHFFRAYQISEGHFLSKKVSKESVNTGGSNLFPGADPNATKYLVGDILPTDLVRVSTQVSDDIIGKQSHKQDTNLVKQFLTFPRDIKTTEFVNFPNSSLYSPVPYIPQSLAILVLKLFNSPVLILMYGGRLMNLAAYCGLTYLAIRFAPKFKLLLAFIALMPMSLQLAASNSPDALLVGISLFLLAWVLYLQAKEELTTKNLVVLGVAVVVMAFQKSAYFPLILILSLLLKNKKYWLQLACISVLVLLSATSWAYFSKELFTPLRTNVDIYKQITFIKDDPVRYLLIMKNTLVGHRNYFVEQFVGGLGWLDVPFSTAVAYAYIIFLLGISLFGDKIQVSQRVIFVISGAATTFLAITMIYLSWVPVGRHVIEGLVGRYFIPTMPYILAAGGGLIKIPRVIGKFEKALLVIPVTVLIYAVYLIYFRYYI